ncbi:hypothetical protein CBS101457_005825 [Exobasidium rhododendri]|nr:hypothetical protein CBS101457_005825 [Exobasidium rhododendri]
MKTTVIFTYALVLLVASPVIQVQCLGSGHSSIKTRSSSKAWVGPDEWGVKPGATFCPFPEQLPEIKIDPAKWKRFYSYTSLYQKLYDHLDDRDRWQFLGNGMLLRILNVNTDAAGGRQLHITTKSTKSGGNNAAIAVKLEYPTDADHPSNLVPHEFVLYPDETGCITTTGSSIPGKYPINVSAQVIEMSGQKRRRRDLHHNQKGHLL